MYLENKKWCYLENRQDSLETVLHAESKCHVWFEAKSKQEEILVERQSPEHVSTAERCMTDGS